MVIPLVILNERCAGMVHKYCIIERMYRVSDSVIFKVRILVALLQDLVFTMNTGSFLLHNATQRITMMTKGGVYMAAKTANVTARIQPDIKKP